MHFTKMQGIGNDYVYVNCFTEKVDEPEKTAKRISDRHFGIGSDGLILIKPSDTADFEMDMYNADGTRGRMCGNGIRCVGKYVYDHGLTDKKELDIATGSGIRRLVLETADGKCLGARVDMGAPILKPSDIPALYEGVSAVGVPFQAGGKDYRITCVSMGNPHCVAFLDEDVRDFPLEKIGPLFEKSPVFPDRVNAEFATVQNRHAIRMRVWERGSGETYACGTGACATGVAAILNGLCESPVTLHLLGGDLLIEWDGRNGSVFMTGPAEEVFEGEINV